MVLADRGDTADGWATVDDFEFLAGPETCPMLPNPPTPSPETCHVSATLDDITRYL